MTHSMVKAWGLGAVIVCLAYATWFISLWANQFTEVLAFFLWGAPALAAFVTAYLTPRRKILMGTSMAFLAAILAGILNFVYEALGRAVDFSGIRGMTILVVIFLAFNGMLCIAGATCGYFLTRKSTSENQSGFYRS